MRENKELEVRGYKVFNSDWTCRDKKYTCPGRFKEEGELEICEHGMHFCLNAADCFRYYDFDSNNHVAEVIAHGNMIQGEDKCCTDDLEIVREIPWDEVLRIVNTGNHNTGYYNTGDCNTGDCNTGNRNTGNYNAGNYNAGNYNTGYYNTGCFNTGNRNTGDCNTGDCNTGNYNTGNRNTGDCNTGDCNTGCFNTKESNIFLFDKSSDWSYQDWLHSEARQLLNDIPKNVVEWIWSDNMDDEEKEAHPEHETTGGYLKILDESECSQIWWDSLTEQQKEVIRNIPNYDREIFEQIMGITTE